ncbi:MAG TPA: glutathione S-transferase N-terminal domain-containing protein, partial [Burkholderiales bacterium]|nr:glutathione S-transferase N-terminal domain-containing protein [Burkholderiales bacterium]
MLKIWGRKNSINVQKVLWCCAELDVKYERVDAGMEHGVNNTPEYRALNPNGLVPTIDHDGFILWESHAIVRYLSGLYGLGTLWPGSPRAFAEADRWME